MDIRKIIAMVLRKWPVIVITAFIGAVAMYVFSSVYVTPIYSAKATMIVNKSQYQASEQNQMSYNDILMTQKLVKSYTIIMTSDTNLDLVKKELDTEMSIGAIRRSVKVSSVGETEVLQISVEHADPVLAQNIANALVKVSPATIIRVIKAGSAEVIDYALVPQSPVKPVVWQYGALGALIGLMLALAMIFLRDYFDNTFKTEDDIREVLDLPVITSLPEIMKDGNTVLTGETPFDYKEAFKVLRTKIQFSGIDGQMKKIAITSSGPFECKTTFSINTAYALAETSKSVLLVDCDLRKPKVSKTLDIGQEPGLSNVLTQDSELELAIRNLEDFDTLDIIPCGVIPPNPAELLGSEQMGKFLDEIDSEYDYIIFDTPPVGLVADTAELSKFLDGVIWVVSYGRTIKESAIFAKETLDSVSANIIGCVFNRVKADGYGTRGYYRRYGYGGRYGYKYGYRRYGYGYGGRYSYRYGYGYGEEDPERAAKRGIFGYFGNGKADDDKKGDD